MASSGFNNRRSDPAAAGCLQVALLKLVHVPARFRAAKSDLFMHVSRQDCDGKIFGRLDDPKGVPDLNRTATIMIDLLQTTPKEAQPMAMVLSAFPDFTVKKAPSLILLMLSSADAHVVHIVHRKLLLCVKLTLFKGFTSARYSMPLIPHKKSLLLTLEHFGYLLCKDKGLSPLPHTISIR